MMCVRLSAQRATKFQGRPSVDRASEFSSSIVLVWMRAHRYCNLHPGIKQVVIALRSKNPLKLAQRPDEEKRTKLSF